jgi:hypothetical protein
LAIRRPIPVSPGSAVQLEGVGDDRELVRVERVYCQRLLALGVVGLALLIRISESYLYSDVITGSEPDVGKAADAIHALLHAPPTTRRRRRRAAARRP